MAAAPAHQRRHQAAPAVASTAATTTADPTTSTAAPVTTLPAPTTTTAAAAVQSGDSASPATTGRTQVRAAGRTGRLSAPTTTAPGSTIAALTASAKASGRTTTQSDACGPLIPKPDGGYWSCTLDATFTGSTLDRSLWWPETTAATSFHSGPECLVDSPNNISVANGVLTLTVRKEAQPFVCTDPGQGDFTTQYTGATISTYGLWSQAYGRFEVKAKVPTTSVPGLQESFWMWPVDDTKYGSWPLSGEIDIAEVYSEYADRAIPFIHYNNYTDPNVTNDYCFINIGNWNTYDVTWTPTSISMSYNGKTCLTDNWSPLLPQMKPAPFDQPFFLVLSAVLGVAPNTFDPATTPLPASTEVQYVRAWK